VAAAAPNAGRRAVEATAGILLLPDRTVINRATCPVLFPQGRRRAAEAPPAGGVQPTPAPRCSRRGTPLPLRRRMPRATAPRIAPAAP
jgi:hypothetical protein